jgi:sterol desaturase/sphingolipid hydroxylase (fatty acid hydroxylase superfamily)
MPEILQQVLGSAAWFAVCMIVFSVLAVLMPLHPRQPLWRRESRLDTVYWFLPAILYAPLGLAMASAGLYLMHGGDQERMAAFISQGYPPIAGLPLWVQFLLLLAISDFIQYWIHRTFHRSAFWKFHAIHHSPKELDWMVAARFHPVNFIVSSLFVGTLMILLGFSPVLFAMMVPFNYLYSGMVHANVNWTFGPLKYFFASPVFHHWHHTMSDQGGNKNFAATLAIYDVLFGTFYMPADKLPEQYGVDSDDVPEHFVGQLFYPFLKPEVAAELAESGRVAAIVGSPVDVIGEAMADVPANGLEIASPAPLVAANRELAEPRASGLPAGLWSSSDDAGLGDLSNVNASASDPIGGRG